MEEGIERCKGPSDNVELMSCFADFAIELKDFCRTKKAKTAISMDPAAEARTLTLTLTLTPNFT